ncbi:hypothetical protein INT48_000410 [Thamnidium elegans]|uniref:DUF202 domain-containing protein n=1 Tax=Thamnidium elegans TaxID=101142 RepID=A0A8H7VSW6_9FUNG|nr:hypothetical protein INT48_000410 [Thamnidium elegans]
MSSESRPIMSTVQTRQNYLAFSESVDPLYRQAVDSLSIHRCSSFSTSIREIEDDEYFQPERCPTRETTGEDKEDRELRTKQTRSNINGIAYVQRWESFFDLFSFSLYLENNVAVARDHLANERTYLAWVRTSLSTISIGVAITQLFRLDKDMFKDPEIAEEMASIGRPLGVSFVVIGIFYMIFALIRYFHSQVAMTKGYFPASRGIIIVSSAATFVALIIVFINLLQRQ